MVRSSVKHARLVGSSLLGLTVLVAGSFAAADTPAVDGVATSSDAMALATGDSTAAAPAPTWSMLYRKYLAKGTVGDCASCHAEAATPARAYAWLAAQQYMQASPPYLIDPRSSCFSWLGGDMPPNGPSSYAGALTDFEDWASAGATSQ